MLGADEKASTEGCTPTEAWQLQESRVEELFQGRMRNRLLDDSLIVMEAAPQSDRSRNDDGASQNDAH